MRQKKWVALPIVLLLGATVAYLVLKRPAHSTSDLIRVSGNIEITDAEVSFKIPGRVEKRLVDEGQLVEQGAAVATLETGDLEAEVAMREADLRAVQSQLAAMEAGARPGEIAAAKARFTAAEADRTRLESDFKSAQQLLQTKVISDEEFAHRKGLFEAAAARMQEASEQFKLIQEGPRREDIDQTRAKVEQTRAALSLAQTRLNYAKLVSPLTGVVLSKNVEPGEYVAPGTPVVVVGALSSVWLRAYIDETDLGRVKLGQTVSVTTDTYPGRKYEGQVSFIASQAEFTPKNVQTQKERVKLVYRIKVDLPNPKMELKPGMPADAEIRTDSHPQPDGRH